MTFEDRVAHFKTALGEKSSLKAENAAPKTQNPALLLAMGRTTGQSEATAIPAE